MSTDAEQDAVALAGAEQDELSQAQSRKQWRRAFCALENSRESSAKAKAKRGEKTSLIQANKQRFCGSTSLPLDADWAARSASDHQCECGDPTPLQIGAGGQCECEDPTPLTRLADQGQAQREKKKYFREVSLLFRVGDSVERLRKQREAKELVERLRKQQSQPVSHV